MGSIKEQLCDNEEASNLPPEAFLGYVDQLDIDDSWLVTADQDDQMIAMRVWFVERYFNGRMAMKAGQRAEAIYGIRGAVDPEAVITNRFRNRVEKQILQDVIDELVDEGGRDWAAKPDPDYGRYDEDFAIEVKARTQPLANLNDRIAEVKELATLQGSAKAQELARRSAYSAAITALESFLWETMVFWVENRKQVVENLVISHPHFKDEQIKLGTIFQKVETLKEDILGFMQNVVWHRGENVGPLFKYGLGLKLSFGQFSEAMKKRHDIVHRSGHTLNGERVTISEQEIDDLCKQIVSFATDASENVQDPDDLVPF